MKLYDRHAVDETSPKVYIGRRIFTNRQGNEQVAQVWYAECTHGGRTHYAPLKTASLSVAIHRAHQFSEKLRAQPNQPTRQVIDLTELARQYLTMQINRDRSPKTIDKYEYALAAFVAWAGKQFQGNAAQFTESLFWAWHKSLVDAGYSEKTRSGRLVLVKSMFKWGHQQKLITNNPLQLARVREPSPTVQPCFEPVQVDALITNAADPLERAIFAILAYAGLRIGEVRSLRWSDVAMPADRPGHILVRDGGSQGKPKDHDFRRVPLNPTLREILSTVPRLGDRVFYSPPSKRHPLGDRLLNESTWLKRLKVACKRCGFVNPNQYKIHTFRHAFASMCARSNLAYRYALAWMGHSSSDILDLYFKQFDSAADAAIATISYPAANPRDDSACERKT